MLDKIITYSFYLLFFLTPLFWTPLNYELFEFNKMLVVYFLTVVIVGAWLLKMVNRKSLIVNRSPLDIPLLLFLAANILSTIFSIDKHSSIFGYYSRSNGGLLSIISYTLLYFAVISNLDKGSVIKLLKMGILGGVVVSLWAIPEHFGISPSCVILRGEFNASCWVQDVEARVFATLGQPNWLANYLSMLIFPALYFLLTAAPKMLLKWYGVLIILYLAFTFTYSRSGTLGLAVGLAVFTLLSFWRPKADGISKKMLPFHFIRSSMMGGAAKPFLIALVSFLLINLLFGSGLTRFNLAQYLSQPSSAPTNIPNPISAVTQLEVGGTDAGKIRLIVWQGALDIFKAYPLLGTGVETFAYSYYQYRPVAHNLVSEWDFLYNKAHNEFLNYLANTGILGLGTYLAIIITFIIWAMGQVLSIKGKSKNTLNTNYLILIPSLLASYISYHVGNFFGFSVVSTALFFYLFPAIAFVHTDSTKLIKWPKTLYILYSILHTHSIYTKAIKLALLLTIIYCLLTIIKIWIADSQFALGSRSDEAGNPGRAYNYLTAAATLRPDEPFYKSELGLSAASSALALSDSDATLSGQLKDAAVAETEATLQISPKNTSYWRTAIRTYYQLSGLEAKFTDKTLETVDHTITLAPTDAKLYYNKAIILGQAARNEEAIEALKKAIELKPNYREAYFALSLFQFDEGERELAVENMNKILQLVPGDQDAISQLNEWGKQGIATKSANGQ